MRWEFRCQNLKWLPNICVEFYCLKCCLAVKVDAWEYQYCLKISTVYEWMSGMQCSIRSGPHSSIPRYCVSPTISRVASADFLRISLYLKLTTSHSITNEIEHCWCIHSRAKHYSWYLKLCWLQYNIFLKQIWFVISWQHNHRRSSSLNTRGAIPFLMPLQPLTMNSTLNFSNMYFLNHHCPFPAVFCRYHWWTAWIQDRPCSTMILAPCPGGWVSGSDASWRRTKEVCVTSYHSSRDYQDILLF